MNLAEAAKARMSIEEQLAVEDHLSRNRDYVNTLRQDYRQDQAEIFKQIVIISVAVIGFKFVYTIGRLDQSPELAVWLLSNISLIVAVYLTLRFYSEKSSMQALEVERILENKLQSDDVEAKRGKKNVLRKWVFRYFGLALWVFYVVFFFIDNAYRNVAKINPDTLIASSLRRGTFGDTPKVPAFFAGQLT